MAKNKWMASLVVSSALALAACGTDTKPVEEPNAEDPGGTTTTEQTTGEETPNAADDSKGQTADGKDSSSNSNTTDTNDPQVTPGQAFQTFMDKYPDVTVNKIELDSDDGSAYMYKLEGFDSQKEYEVKIDPNSGDIVKEETDNDDDDNRKKEELTMEDIDRIKGYIEETLRDVDPEYRIHEWQLEKENGQPIFEIEVVNESGHDIDYKYNVESGEMLKKDS